MNPVTNRNASPSQVVGKSPAHSSATPGLDQFFTLVDEVRTAQHLLDAFASPVLRPSPPLLRHRDEAQQVLGRTAGRSFTLTIACMLCQEPVELDISVGEYASLLAAPRGICHRH